MKIAIEVPDRPHSRTEVDVGDGAKLIIIVPLGLSPTQEREVGSMIVRLGESMQKSAKLDD